MVYTLGQAAKATGKTKTTIAKAIAKGRISAQKDDIGQYVIDPAELHRVYPFTVENSDKVDDSRPHGDHGLLLEIATLKAKLEAMNELNHQIEAERDRLHEQNTRITALLSAPKADPYAAILQRLEAIEKEVVSTNQAPEVEPPKKGFWARLVG
jgi:tRNA G37 N-methylase TrmD